MKVTIELLKEWRACQDALDWWNSAHPYGEDESLEVLVNKIIPEKYRKDWGEWFLREVAARVDGPVGVEALEMLSLAADPSLLAWIVTTLTDRDTSTALDRLVKEGRPEHLARVLERGSLKDAESVAAALLSRDPSVAKFCERTMQAERATLLTAARRAG